MTKSLTAQDEQPLKNSQGLSLKTTDSISIIESGKKLIASDHAQSLTIEKAQQSIQLSALKKDKGVPYSELILINILNESLKFLPNQLTVPDKADYAKMILSTYWDLKIDDIILIFKNGIAGNYGKLYGNFHYSTFTEWVHEYLKAKEDYYIGINSKKFEPSSGERTGEQTIKQLLKK